eukprot:m.118114 g.118114  ORF g.118114 m.118114 type:complete len:139 (-) comp17198_c0_seq2:846-1262(-)
MYFVYVSQRTMSRIRPRACMYGKKIVGGYLEVTNWANTNGQVAIPCIPCAVIADLLPMLIETLRSWYLEHVVAEFPTHLVDTIKSHKRETSHILGQHSEGQHQDDVVSCTCTRCSGMAVSGQPQFIAGSDDITVVSYQ